MAKNCVNIGSTEFKNLVNKTEIPAIDLAGIIGKWQDVNNTDEFPTAKEISEYVLKRNAPEVKNDLTELSNQNIEGLIEKFYKLQDDSSEAKTMIDEFNNRGEESMDVTARKVELMQKALNAEVILDGSAEYSSLLPASHPITKKYGKPVIVLNPNKIFSDTVIHEFGHLYIDLLGSEDGLVQDAISLLRDTSFYDQIAAKYPELSQEDLDKEVLATALGLEGNKLFQRDLSNLTKWQKIKQYILNKMREIFGMNTNALEKLASEMLTANTRLTGTEVFNTAIDQKSKFSIARDSRNRQQDILDLFKTIKNEFTKESVDGKNYYKSKDGTIHTNSVTNDIKGYKKNSNKTDKGDIEMVFDRELYTEDNILLMLNDKKIPSALAEALNDITEGRIPTSFVQEAKDTNWLQAYNREIALGEVSEARKSILFTKNLLDNFDAVMLRAEQAQERKNQAPIAGNIVHDALENYINEGIPFPENLKDEKGELIKSIKEIVDKGRANGSVFVTEQILFSESRSVPGTADLIEITKEGKAIIYDFKTTKSFKYGNSEAEKSDNTLYFSTGYMHQLASYGAMLSQYGIELAKNPYVIVMMEVKYSGITDMNGEVSVGEVRTKNLNDKNTSVVMNNVRQIMTKRYSSNEQLSSIKIKQEINDLADLSEKINNYINVYKKRTRNLSSELDDSSIKKIKDDLVRNQLETDLNKYIAKNNEVIIKSYVNNIHSALGTLEAQKDALGEHITPEYLQSLNYIIQVSGVLNDIKRLLTDTNDIEVEDQDELLKLIDESLKVINNNEKYYKEKLKRLAIYTLAENSNLMYGLYSEKYKLKARELGKRSKEEINAYVEQELKASEEIRKVKEIEYWTKQYEDGVSDLRFAEYLLADPGMSKSQFVQLVKNIMDKTDNAIRNRMMDVMPEIANWHKKLSFDTKGDPKKVWGKFLEYKEFVNPETLKKERMLASSVIPEFTSDYREMYLKYEYAIKADERYLKKLEDIADKTDKEENKIAKLKERIANLRDERVAALKKGSKKDKFTEQRINPEFAKLNNDEQEALRFIHKNLLEGDERLSSNQEKMLVTKLRDGTFVFNLPRKRMSNIEASHNLEEFGGRIKSGFQEMLTPSSDSQEQMGLTEDEQKEFGTDDKTISNNLNIYGEEVLEVPVYYRNELDDESLQSYDIPTLLALNHETTITYQENTLAEADLFVIKESLNSKNNDKILKTDSFVNKRVQDATGKIYQKSDQNLIYKAVKSSIDNRLYKRAYSGVYSKTNYRLIKGAEAISSYASTVALAGNFMSALSTFSQGSIYRLIEGKVGEHLNTEDWKVGSKKAWGDIGEIVKDTQRYVPESKTNLLIKKFGLENQLTALTNKFVQDNFLKKNLDHGTLYGVTSMAESMVTANLMYSLLNNIKVQNKNGDYINKEGKVVDKSKAMTLDEAYDVIDGKLTLNKNVSYTSFNLTDSLFDETTNSDNTMAATEISRYIRSVYADLYGQYNQDMKSVAQRNIAGKLAMNLRGWLPRGAHKRWRGISTVFGEDALSFEDLRKEENIDKRFYSQDQKQFTEGHYTTTLRFIMSLKKEMTRNQLAYGAAKNKTKNLMTDHELANLKRTQYEIAIMLTMLTISLLLRNLAKNMEGDDEEKQKFYFAAYLAHRIKDELATFISPPSMFEIASTPASSMTFIERIFGMLSQLVGFSFEDGGINWNINDEYEKGPKKGENKALIKSLGLIPGTVKFNQMMSILGLESNNTIEDSFEYAIRN